MKNLKISKWTLCLAVGVLLVFAAVPSHSQPKVYLDIGPGGGRQLPIAIPPFKNLTPESGDEALGWKLGQVLADDLGVTGLFRILDPVTFLEDPLQGGLEPEDIDFRDWTAIGAETLIKGGFRVEGEQLEIEARLFVVVQGAMAVGKKYTVKLDDYRQVSHNFANEVLKSLSGESGIFDTQIAFISSRRGNKEIFVMDYDGFNVRQLTRNGSTNLKPAWSPDGARLSFTSFQQGQPSLYMLELAQAKVQSFGLSAEVATGGVWSPDGSLMTAVLSRAGNADLYLLDPDGQILRRLTDHFAIDVDPAWSPDGESIAFTSNRSGSPQVHLMKVSGQEVQRLTFEGNYNSGPAWSPRGDQIVFSSLANGRFDIFLIHPDGSGLLQLTRNAGDNTDPVWSPDGRLIAFTSTRSGREAIYVMNTVGQFVRRLQPGETPAWSPRKKR